MCFVVLERASCPHYLWNPTIAHFKLLYSHKGCPFHFPCKVTNVFLFTPNTLLENHISVLRCICHDLWALLEFISLDGKLNQLVYSPPPPLPPSCALIDLDQQHINAIKTMCPAATHIEREKNNTFFLLLLFFPLNKLPKEPVIKR